MKTALVVAAVIIALISYIPYFRDIFAGKTKPHAFTWFIWGLLTGIAFFAQLAAGGGVGSIVLGFTALYCGFIFVAGLVVGRKNIAPVDWVFLAGSLFALGLWALTDNPLWSVVLVTVVDAVAFIPTIRKAYRNPYSETLITYLLSGIKFIVAIFALENYSVTTILYPASLVVMNGLFVAMLQARRKVVQPPKRYKNTEIEPELI